MVLSEREREQIALQLQGFQAQQEGLDMFKREWDQAQAAIVGVSDDCRPRTIKADVTSQGGLRRLPNHPPLIHLTKEHSRQVQREAIDKLNPTTRK